MIELGLPGGLKVHVKHERSRDTADHVVHCHDHILQREQQMIDSDIRGATCRS